MGASPAQGGAAVEPEPVFDEEVIPPEMAAVLQTSREALEKFVKLPARPVKQRTLYGQTQVSPLFSMVLKMPHLQNCHNAFLQC